MPASQDHDSYVPQTPVELHSLHIVQVMISYSRSDSTFVDQLQSDLVKRGFPVWLDRSNIEGGARWADDIYDAVDSSQVILVVCSPAAMSSPWVYREYHYALSRNKIVIPLLYQPCRMPKALARLQSVDFLLGIDFEAKYLHQIDALVPVLAGYEPIEGAILQGGRGHQRRAIRSPVRLRVKDRKRFLNKLTARYTYWYSQALQGMPWLHLRLASLSPAVDQLQSAIREVGDVAEQLVLPPDQISTVYDNAQGNLLILGAPGAGKTMQVIALAQVLVERARRDTSAPLPVVLNLASWAQKELPLSVWMIGELTDAYDVPRHLARAWVDAKQILPLLDGLDEVADSRRAACADAINTYCSQGGPQQVVMCCRTDEYSTLSSHLNLKQAIELEPLTYDMVQAALSTDGNAFQGLRAALDSDPGLRELVTTPLMLSVMALAYAERPSDAIPQAAGQEEFRRTIFGDYITRMVRRHRGGKSYTRSQVVQWLSWLAAEMKTHGRSEFYLERMQPDWLSDRQSLHWYRVTVRIAVCLLGGLAYAIAGVLSAGLVPGAVVGLAVGLSLGFLVKLPAPGANQSIEANVRRSSSRERVALTYGLSLTLVVGIPVGLLVGRTYAGEGDRLAVGLAAGIAIGLFVGLTAGLSAWQVRGLNPSIETVDTLRWSWRSMGIGLAIGLATGLGAGVIAGLAGGLALGLGLGLPLGLGWAAVSWGVIYGVISGLPIGLVFAIPIGLIFGLASGVGGRQIDEHDLRSPNEGLRRSLRNALLVIGIATLGAGFLTGLLAWSVGLLLGSQASEILNGPIIGLEFGATVGLVLGVSAGLARGAGASVEHAALRLQLQQRNLVPSGYVQFLNFCSDRVLLQRVGGGYRFMHAMLQDYFASLYKVGAEDIPS